MKKNFFILNKKGLYNYEIFDKFICGMVLYGPEVKSIKNHNISFNDSYVIIKNNFVILKNFHISKYKYGFLQKHNELRDKHLLLNKREILKIKQKQKVKKYIIIPVDIFIKNSYIKITIALAKKKSKYNKKQKIKLKDLKRSQSFENRY